MKSRVSQATKMSPWVGVHEAPSGAAQKAPFSFPFPALFMGKSCFCGCFPIGYDNHREVLLRSSVLVGSGGLTLPLISGALHHPPPFPSSARPCPSGFLLPPPPSKSRQRPWKELLHPLANGSHIPGKGSRYGKKGR